MNKLPISPSSLQERKAKFLETLLNHSDKVSKVSDHSVLGGIAYGVASLAGKAEKDIAIAVGQIYPQFSSGDNLDLVAENFGISPRMEGSPSTLWARVVGQPGIQYLPNVHTFYSSSGISFTPDKPFTMPSQGFGYLSLRSVVFGSSANIPPLTLTSLSPTLQGHQYVTNEVGAVGGRDVERDEDFRKRIQQGANLLSRNTVSGLEQYCISVNPLVSKIVHCGVNDNGKTVLGIVTINGTTLSTEELSFLSLKVKDRMAFTDLPSLGSSIKGFELVNVPLYPIDVSLRVKVDTTESIDNIRLNLMFNIQNYLLKLREKNYITVEWDDLLVIAKRTNGISYVSDQYFYPHSDINIPKNTFPILRGFRLLNLEGGLIVDFSGNLVPSFYPQQVDFQYQTQLI